MSKILPVADETLSQPQPRQGLRVSLKIKRRLSQMISLALLGQWSFYGIFRCPFIVPYISCQNCPVITCHGRLLSLFWGFWLLLPLSALIFGRAFCSWVCPGGLVQQVLGSVAPIKLRLKNRLTRFLPYSGYLALITAAYCYFVLGQPRTNVPIRVGDFLNSITLTFAHAQPLWLVRTSVVLGIFAVGLIVAGFWCRFICPTGGLLEIVRPLAFFRFYKNENCNNCDKCLGVCEMGTRPDESQCTNCGDCKDMCPTNAISFGHHSISKSK